MNFKHYEGIYDIFREQHSEVEKNVEDFRPLSDIAIRLTMKDGSKYDFDILSKGLRKAQEEYYVKKGDITDGMCRKSFAKHLCDLMLKRGYNQQTLSEYTGISKGSINGYINETKTPSLTNVRKIAYALNCSVAELID